MQPAAASRLGDLQSVYHRVTSHYCVKMGAGQQKLFQNSHADPEALSRHLDHSAMRTPVQTNHHGDRSKAFLASYCNFDALAISVCNHQRNHPFIEEISELQASTWLVQTAVVRQVHKLQVRPHIAKFRIRKR